MRRRGRSIYWGTIRGDRDDNTDYTHQTDGGLIPPTTGYFADSADNLLLTGTGNDGAVSISECTI